MACEELNHNNKLPLIAKNPYVTCSGPLSSLTRYIELARLYAGKEAI
jgi:hypothetical protein